MAGITLVVGPLSGALLGRAGPRPSLLIGGAGLCAGGLMLTGLTAGTAPGWLFAAYAVFGIGFGAINAPITNTAVSGMPPAQAGVAAAIASTSRQVGASLGIAVSGAVAVARSGSAVAGHAGWWIVAGCGALVLALGVASTSRPALRTAAALGDLESA
jgi:MFS family permease